MNSIHPKQQHSSAMESCNIQQRLYTHGNVDRHSEATLLNSPKRSQSIIEQKKNSFNLDDKQQVKIAPPILTLRSIFRNTIPPRQPQRVQSIDANFVDDNIVLEGTVEECSSAIHLDEFSPSCPPPLPNRNMPFYELSPKQPQRCISIDETSNHRTVSSLSTEEHLEEVMLRLPSRTSLYEQRGQQPSLPSLYEKDEESHNSLNDLLLEQILSSLNNNIPSNGVCVTEVDYESKVMKKLNDASVLMSASPPTMPRRRSTKIATGLSADDMFCNASLLSSCTFDFDDDDVSEELLAHHQLAHLDEPDVQAFLRMAPTMPHRRSMYNRCVE